jgi:hypothetical protein
MNNLTIMKINKPANVIFEARCCDSGYDDNTKKN